MEKNNLPVGTLRLLPHVWKTVGFAVAAVMLAALFIVAALHAKFLMEYGMSVFILGLLLAALSKDRYEDEMLMTMRLIAFFMGFGFGVLDTALRPFFALIDLIHTERSATGTVLIMLFMYHAMFIWMKRRARREKHD